MVARKFRALGNAFNNSSNDWQGLPWSVSPLLAVPPEVQCSQFVNYGVNRRLPQGTAGGGCGCGCDGAAGAGPALDSVLGLPWWVWVGGVAFLAYPLLKGAR